LCFFDVTCVERIGVAIVGFESWFSFFSIKCMGRDYHGGRVSQQQGAVY